MRRVGKGKGSTGGARAGAEGPGSPEGLCKAKATGAVGVVGVVTFTDPAPDSAAV